MELDFNQLSQISGGELTDEKKDFLREFMKRLKSDGRTMEDLLALSNDPEINKYITDMWPHLGE